MQRGLFDPFRSPVPRAHEDPKLHSVKVYSVHELNQRVKAALEERLGAIWVEGEVTNLSRPQSGHVYFTLKDDQAQAQAVMWRALASKLPFEIKDGDKVKVFGRLTVYEPRGLYQIAVERVEFEGLGTLQQRFDELKARLAAEGLFDQSRKRPLPLLPRRIALVTSPSGAALQDMLRVIWRRHPKARLALAPVPVQGAKAAGEIARAIDEINLWNDRSIARTGQAAVDVCIVGRGGGSLEDLWAFNEEVVVRAIRRSRIPVVSAVGHEVDVSLADLAADVRALTPSDAGARVTPQVSELEIELDLASRRLASAQRGRIEREAEVIRLIERSYGLHSPRDILARERQRADGLAVRVGRAGRMRLDRSRDALADLAGKLDELSPLGVLARGYSVTSRAERSEPLRDAAELAPGDRLVTRLARGLARSIIESVEKPGIVTKGD